MNQNTNTNNKQPTQLKLDDKNSQFFVNLVLDFVYHFNLSPVEYQIQNNPNSSLKIVLTGDIAMNIYKTKKKIPEMLTMLLVGGDISKKKFDVIMEKMKEAFSKKLNIDKTKYNEDFCWLFQFEGIFDGSLNPIKKNNNSNQQNQSKITPKISFEIIKEKPESQNNVSQEIQTNNTTKKLQHKIGIKLVIESDKKYELPFLEMITTNANANANAIDAHFIQIYPNIFIPNQSGISISAEDELSCAVLLKLHTYERNTKLFGLNEFKEFKKKNNGKLTNTTNNTNNTNYSKEYKTKLNNGINDKFIEKLSETEKKLYHDKIRALYDKCGVFYRKEYDSLFQGKLRMYGRYKSEPTIKRENIKGNEESQQKMNERLKNGIRVINTSSSIDYVPNVIYSIKFTDKEQPGERFVDYSNRFSLEQVSSIQLFHNQILGQNPFIKLTSFNFLPNSYQVQAGSKASDQLFLSDIENLKLIENTKEYVLQFRINPDNEYNVQLQFLATKWYMIIVNPLKNSQSPNIITLYEQENNTKKHILTVTSQSTGGISHKFYRHKVKCIKVVKTYMSIVYNGMTYVCDVSVLIFEETEAAVAE